MAKDPEDEKEKKPKKKKKKGKKRGGQVLWLLGCMAVPATSILLLVSMLPTIVAGMTHKKAGGALALTVGAMNLAGATPFLLDLWMTDHSIDNALSIVSDINTMVIIYSAAALGYMIDWAMSGVVMTVLMQRSRLRLRDIEKQQAVLVERWGPKVTGGKVLPGIEEGDEGEEM